VRHNLSVRLALPILRLVVRALMLVLGPTIVKGAYRVPRTGGVLVLSNHIADFDPVLVQASCRRLIHFMAKSELFEMKLLRPVIRWFHAFPVKRGEPDRAAIRKAIDLLQAGEVVCIFPEGELSVTGELQDLLPGASLIVRKAGVPVICCGIRNTNRIMPYGNFIPRPALCFTHARWGEARQFDRRTSNDEILAWAEAQLRELTDQE